MSTKKLTDSQIAAAQQLLSVRPSLTNKIAYRAWTSSVTAQMKKLNIKSYRLSSDFLDAAGVDAAAGFALAVQTPHNN